METSDGKHLDPSGWNQETGDAQNFTLMPANLRIVPGLIMPAAAPPSHSFVKLEMVLEP